MEIVILIITLFVLIIIVKTLLIRNKEVRTLNFDNETINKQYAQEAFDLIKIKTPSEEDSATYHEFREKMKELFPLVHQKLKRKKLGSNVIFTYEVNEAFRPHILIVSHIDTFNVNDEVYMTDKEIRGEGSFDSKALVYAVFQAMEEKLNEEINVNIMLIITTDDKASRTGSEQLVNYFTRRGLFFNLVLEDGAGIIDPYAFDLKSNHALIGVGVTGEVIVRYQAKKRHVALHNLENFIEEIKEEDIFKAKIDRNSAKVLKAFSKDMNFKNRLLFGNPNLFSFFIKRKLNKHKIEIGKLIKTQVDFSKIKEDDEYYYSDCTFGLATHDTPAEIIRTIAPYVQKYELTYEVSKIADSSKVTSEKSEGYKKVEDVIDKTFSDVYVTPYIITKFSERRYFTRVSDCVIRFSPLYYDHEKLTNALEGNESLSKLSLNKAIRFYKKLIESYEE